MNKFKQEQVTIERDDLDYLLNHTHDDFKEEVFLRLQAVQVKTLNYEHMINDPDNQVKVKVYDENGIIDEVNGVDEKGDSTLIASIDPEGSFDGTESLLGVWFNDNFFDLSEIYEDMSGVMNIDLGDKTLYRRKWLE